MIWFGISSDFEDDSWVKTDFVNMFQVEEETVTSLRASSFKFMSMRSKMLIHDNWRYSGPGDLWHKSIIFSGQLLGNCKPYALKSLNVNSYALDWYEPETVWDCRPLYYRRIRILRISFPTPSIIRWRLSTRGQQLLALLTLQRYTSFESGSAPCFSLKSSLSLISTRFLPDRKQRRAAPTSRCATYMKASLAETLLSLNVRNLCDGHALFGVRVR
jgi:hypothetical protein